MRVPRAAWTKKKQIKHFHKLDFVLFFSEIPEGSRNGQSCAGCGSCSRGQFEPIHPNYLSSLTNASDMINKKQTEKSRKARAIDRIWRSVLQFSCWDITRLTRLKMRAVQNLYFAWAYIYTVVLWLLLPKRILISQKKEIMWVKSCALVNWFTWQLYIFQNWVYRIIYS